MYDHHPKWRLVQANLKNVDGIYLDEIEPDKDIQGMVLIHRDWNHFYLMSKRQTWEPDHYLEYAKRRIKEIGYFPP